MLNKRAISDACTVSHSCIDPSYIITTISAEIK